MKSQVVPLDDAAKRLLPLDFPASALGLVIYRVGVQQLLGLVWFDSLLEWKFPFTEDSVLEPGLFSSECTLIAYEVSVRASWQEPVAPTQSDPKLDPRGNLNKNQKRLSFQTLIIELKSQEAFTSYSLAKDMF